MINSFSHELALGDVYMSPFLAVIIIAFLFTGITVFILNKLKLSHYFFAPSFSIVAIMVLYIVLVDSMYIKF